MRPRVASSLIAFALILSSVPGALGQQARPNGVSIAQLREDIEKLESVERDPSAPPEVKELNHGFLQERRRQLYGQVQNRGAALRKYLDDLKTSPTSEEVQAVER